MVAEVESLALRPLELDLAVAGPVEALAVPGAVGVALAVEAEPLVIVGRHLAVFAVDGLELPSQVGDHADDNIRTGSVVLDVAHVRYVAEVVTLVIVVVSAASILAGRSLKNENEYRM